MVFCGLALVLYGIKGTSTVVGHGADLCSRPSIALLVEMIHIGALVPHHYEGAVDEPVSTFCSLQATPAMIPACLLVI